MSDIRRPIARSENLVIQELADEVLVYDLSANQAHCLNETAAFVWSNCKGEKSIDEIAGSFEKRFGQAVDADYVRLAIKQLDDKSLLTESGIRGLAMPSRRDAIRKIGLATAVALPMVASLVAPSSALASVSCLCQLASSCTPQPSCPQGFCVGGICSSSPATGGKAKG